jgi:hypothetical protein
MQPHIAASIPSSSRNSSSSCCSGTAASHRLKTVARANNSDRPGSSNNGGRSQEPRRSKPDRKARKPGLFEIKVVTPPPRCVECAWELAGTLLVQQCNEHIGSDCFKQAHTGIGDTSDNPYIAWLACGDHAN